MLQRSVGKLSVVIYLICCRQKSGSEQDGLGAYYWTDTCYVVLCYFLQVIHCHIYINRSRPIAFRISSTHPNPQKCQEGTDQHIRGRIVGNFGEAEECWMGPLQNPVACSVSGLLGETRSPSYSLVRFFDIAPPMCHYEPRGVEHML